MPEPARAWHPPLTAFEPKPGEWWLKGPDGNPYAIVALIRRGGELGYRAVLYAERSEDRQLVGYYRRLKPAVEAAHDSYISSAGYAQKARSR